LRSFNIEDPHFAEITVMRPAGCEQCRNTGYKGRIGIFEIFEFDDEVRHLVNARASTTALRQRAGELGMRTLREDGLRKVLAGLTNAEEVISMTIGDAN
jgi:general secretion pathway protein E/type IV pilus assembly protein PilB